MVLHSTTYYTTGPTGSGTEDELGSSAFGPTGDNEVQMRIGDTVPKLIGLHTFDNGAARIGGTLMQDYHKIRLNTWTNAQYYLCGPHLTAPHATPDVMASHQPPDWWPGGYQLTRDGDWIIGVMSTTAGNDVGGILYLSYGGMLPYRGGMIISRKVNFATDAAVAPSYGGAQTITDLDPRVQYRVAGLQLGNVENADNVAIKVTSPSNSTDVCALAPSWADTTFHFHNQPVWFPHDSILINGVETVQVDAAAVAVHKPSVVVYFEEYGASGVGRRAPRGRATKGPGGRLPGVGTGIAAQTIEAMRGQK